MPNGARLEKLTIENFAGIRRLEMDVSPFTVLIGPQSVGKSVTAKVLYFFKSLPWTLFEAAARDYVVKCDQAVLRKFQDLFSPETFGESLPSLTWSGGSQCTIQITRGLMASVPDSLRDAYETLAEQRRSESKKTPERPRDVSTLVNDGIRAEQEYWNAVKKAMPEETSAGYFIPAGRSFYAQIERDAASFYSTANIDPYVSEFGRLFSALKRAAFWNVTNVDTKTARKLVNELLSGEYIREDNEDLILSRDGRRLRSVVWSSGQQEAYPLALMLQNHCSGRLVASSIFIEEPEAHLFPTSQRVMTELIALAFNVRSPGTRVFLTTHSPYILTTINNLLQAGMLYNSELSDDRREALQRTVPQDRALAPGSVDVFYMDRDSCRSIMDEETGLIGTSEIDKASWDLSEQFEALLETQPS